MNPGGASSAPKHDASLDAEWQQWKATHGKVYGPNEEGWRRTLWEKNKKMIDLHNEEYNLGRKSYSLGLNAFSDMVGPCRYRPEDSVAKDTGFVDVPGQECALMKAVATVRPISVAIDASHLSFQLYEDGVYYELLCSSVHLDHAVLVVGYGFEGEDSSNNTYWIVKNSWGEGWGQNGYIKMAKDRNNHCGIATAASYPTV